ncbi:MAG: acetylxylan esterase, partial [Bacteroidota bacterium]
INFLPRLIFNDMMIPFLPLIGLCLFLIAGTIGLSAQTTLKVDRPSGIYEVGETVQFNIQTTSSNLATYTLFSDRFASVLASGKVQLSPGASLPIVYRAEEPGNVLCRLVKGNEEMIAGALISPLEIQAFEEEPSDLMDFWNAQLTELAAVPIDPALQFIEESQYTTTHTVSLAMVDNRKVYGYVSVPKGNGPYPAILTLPAFGDNANQVSPDITTAERGGAIALTISIHNRPIDEEDPNAYQPNVINNPDSLYYKWSVLAAVRAIDYLYTRPDFDGVSIGVNGVSQGGGLAAIVAGLDQRVKLLVYSNPALALHHGKRHDQASGFPYYLRASDDNFGSPQHAEATNAAVKYIDAVYFAQRFTGPSLGITSYLDSICPVRTVMTLYNQLAGPKTLGLFRENGHNHPEEYWAGRYDFYRQHFPAMQNPPWPWPDTDTGYLAFAGNDQTVQVGAVVGLNGSIQKNGVLNQSWTVQWELEEGPAPIQLMNAQSRNTTVLFSTPGHYRIRFSAFDDDDLNADEPHRFVITDEVNITVQ